MAAAFSGRISAAGRTRAAHCAPVGKAAPTGNVVNLPVGGVVVVVVGAIVVVVVGRVVVVVGAVVVVVGRVVVVVGAVVVVVVVVVVGAVVVVVGAVVVSVTVAAWSFQWMNDDHPTPNTPTLAVYAPAGETGGRPRGARAGGSDRR